MVFEIIIGVLIGIIIILCVILIPKAKHQEKINEDIIRKNEETLHSYEISKHELGIIGGSIKTARAQIEFLEEEKNKLIDAINLQEEQNKKYFQTNKENIDLKYNEYQNNLKNEYLTIAEDLAKNASARIQQIIIQEQEKNEEYNQLVEKYNQLLESAKNDLYDMRSRVSAAVEASRRAEEELNKQDFYRIVIPQDDMYEIVELKDVATHLRNPEPLNKVIWKVYYEKPTNDMIGRVVGQEKKIGIYKITNLKNNKCYIGQAGSSEGFGGRWKQHIKRGLGAETATRNKLYPAMKEFGIENFSFEIIEECASDKLNEREQYWQDFFHAKDYGYSIK